MEDKVNAVEVIRWKTHLFKQYPLKGLVIFLCAVISAFFGYTLFHNALFILLGFFLIAAASVEYIFPVTYELNQKGVVRKCLWQWSEIDWENIKKVYITDDGVKLSPMPKLSRLEAFRGVYLVFNENKDEVIEAIQNRRQEIAAVERTVN